MAQLWGGRFTKETDQLVYNFNASISFDKKFYRQDMEGSMAHVKMLAKQGILTEDERNQILAGINSAFVSVFKKLFDNIQAGNPAVFFDKKLLDEEGNISWQLFNQDLQRNYIAGSILEDMAKWDARFNTEIGIPNVNIAKQSGVSDSEVHANDTDVQSKALVWVEEIRKGFDKANELFGLDLSVKYKYEEEKPEVLDYGENVDSWSVARG